jgi:hypothetical protein
MNRREMNDNIPQIGVPRSRGDEPAMSQNIHIVNSTANSGWVVEENSLTNMDVEQLGEEGARTGLVIETRVGAKDPRKIEPNKVPDGIDRLIERALSTIKEVTVPEAMRGEPGQEISGVAIQSRQFASQQQLTVVLDNRSLSRNLLVRRIDWIIGNYYDSERVIRIANIDPVSGEESTEEIVINQPSNTGYLNDMTIGLYDVVISDVPMQITFENSQFTQALEIRKAGIAVPDWAVVKHSSLADKQDILREMQQQQDPEAQAKAALIQAQTEKTVAEIDKVRAETVGHNVEAQFGAIQTAQTIASIPQTAPLADAMLRSGGYKDHDPAPIIPSPQVQAPVPADIRQNTSPLFPARTASAGAGITEGIETPQPDSVQEQSIGQA